MLKKEMMEMVLLPTEISRRAKLQSDHYHQRTNIFLQAGYSSYQPTELKQ